MATAFTFLGLCPKPRQGAEPLETRNIFTGFHILPDAIAHKRRNGAPSPFRQKRYCLSGFATVHAISNP